MVQKHIHIEIIDGRMALLERMEQANCLVNQLEGGIGLTCLVHHRNTVASMLPKSFSLQVDRCTESCSKHIVNLDMNANRQQRW